MERFIDPKVLLANERTFVAWTKMAVTLGSIGAGLLGAGVDASRREIGADGEGVPTEHTSVAWYIGAILMPVALIFALFAAYTFRFRNNKIRKSQFNNLAGETIPLVLGGILCLSLTSVLIMDIVVGPIVKLK